MFRFRISRITLILLLVVWISDTAQTIFAQEKSADEIKQLILPGETFRIDGHAAFILWPDKEIRTTPQPWVFYAPTLPAYPDANEKWMHQKFLDAGIAVAGVDAGEAYGSPESRKLFDRFYDELTSNRDMSKRPCLLGRSRGGLWVTSWACDHPERFSGLAGIYPVFDFRTYPGLEKAASAYGITVEELTKRNDEFNPIARVKKIAAAKLPVFLIHGDQDKVVPLQENSATFADIYKSADAETSIRLVVVEGQGHNLWEGFFQSQDLVNFIINRAKAGAK